MKPEEIERMTDELMKAVEGSWSAPIYALTGGLIGWACCFITLAITNGINSGDYTPLPDRIAYFTLVTGGLVSGYLVGRSREKQWSELRELIRKKFLMAYQSR